MNRANSNAFVVSDCAGKGKEHKDFRYKQSSNVFQIYDLSQVFKNVCHSSFISTLSCNFQAESNAPKSILSDGCKEMKCYRLEHLVFSLRAED